MCLDFKVLYFSIYSDSCLDALNVKLASLIALCIAACFLVWYRVCVLGHGHPLVQAMHVL